jgi:diguanylate cyclase (GGDEF)-like protein/PAS domain S-box-containing protein
MRGVSGTEPDGSDAEPELLRRIVDGAPILTMTVDGAGTVTWVSGACERLFGYTSADVVGTSILDWLDLEWSPTAIDSIGAALVNSGLQRPMQFRMRRKDGSHSIVEVTANSQLDDPDVGALLVYVRRWDERNLIDRVVDSLAGGVPADDIFRLLVEIMGAENLDGDGVVMLEPEDGRFLRSVASPRLDPVQTWDTGAPDTPWAVARTSGAARSMRVADLPPAVAATAPDHRWCWVWPVPGPDGTAACLVLWRRDDEDVDHTCRFLMEQLVRLTGLVLERERAAADLLHAATHDFLTGLANRTRFFGCLQDALDDGDQGPLIGVLYVDLDGFKPVNDRHGHGMGDLVLNEVGRRLQAVVRDGDLVSRLGGDEFTVLCCGVRNLDLLQDIAERLNAVVAEPIVVGDVCMQVSASVGIAVATPGSCSIDVLVDAADAALYQAKSTEKGSYRFAAAPPTS